MIKLLAIDMDKTCLNDKNQITDETLKALYDIANQGVMIVPTTGRALSCLPNRLQGNLFYTYVISSNGAKVTNVKENRTIYQELMDKGDVISLLSEFKEYRVGITAHINNKYYIEGRFIYKLGTFIYGEDAKSSLNIKSLQKIIRAFPYDIEEIQLFFINSKVKYQIKDVLVKYKDYSASFSKYYVEIVSSQTSKGLALKRLAETLGIQKEEIACVGDGENDLSMFDVSGLKLAMGNANDLLKEKADYILPTNNENGICKVKEYLKY